LVKIIQLRTQDNPKQHPVRVSKFNSTQLSDIYGRRCKTRQDIEDKRGQDKTMVTNGCRHKCLYIRILVAH